MVKRNKLSRRKKINPTLESMFKMSHEQLLLRKTTGGGVHRSQLHDTPRSEQKRRAIDDQLNSAK